MVNISAFYEYAWKGMMVPEGITRQVFLYLQLIGHTLSVD